MLPRLNIPQTGSSPAFVYSSRGVNVGRMIKDTSHIMALGTELTDVCLTSTGLFCYGAESLFLFDLEIL
jgi:hypothetical protein